MQEIIADSPHSYNHVYHVLDAADFPMSLIPKIQQFLALAPQRGRNRRAAVEKYYKGRKKAELSFIISRADLLAPTKQQVDMLMPYLTEVLRDALGSLGQGVRLGNVYCVSSHRGWWTKKVKDDIWDRGGGSWIVGKVNVGKSSLLENVFPKARSPDVDHGEPHSSRGLSTSSDSLLQPPQGSQAPLSYDSIALLLPPVPQETPFPVMPTVSHLPGTTALPIRLPFGQGRGEVIDLPGLSRGNLADFVLAEHRDNLVMKHRIKAKQLSIKPGQSLVVSNILRITPVSPDVVFLACPFVPIDCHVTNTEKAKAIVSQDITTAVTNIASPEAPEAIAHAGTFKLKWDTTKDRSGPLTAPSAAGLNASRLPFIIYSTDILIEGVGWIELAAQVRRRNIEAGQDTPDEEFSPFPEVEIYSPNGSHVAQRPPMNGWLLGGRRRPPVSQRTSRPRRSMRGVKKMLKAQKRAAIAASSTS